MSTKSDNTANNQVVIHIDPKFVKRVPDPHESRRWNYVGTIPAREAIKLLRGTANPRSANLASKVSGEIRDTIHNAPQEFHLRNRGLIVSTPEANLDTDSKTLTLENPKVEKESILWGILEGGHTFDVLSEEAAAATDGNGSSGVTGV
jgi:AIPR protein